MFSLHLTLITIIRAGYCRRFVPIQPQCGLLTVYMRPQDRRDIILFFVITFNDLPRVQFFITDKNSRISYALRLLTHVGISVRFLF